MRASCERFDTLTHQAVYDLGLENTSIVRASIRSVACFAVVIRAPSPDVSIVRNRQAVIIAGCDVLDLLAVLLDGGIMEADLVRLKRLDETALSNTTTELILLP